MAVLVGKEAPDFKEKAVKDGQVVENFTLSQFKSKRYVVLFFYPMDFTFVCPTEIHEFQNKLSEFNKLGAEVIGVSVDSEQAHVAWLNMPKEKGGIQGVKYPIVADLNKTISQAYDVLVPDGVALRATFIIDKSGVVQSELVNNLPIGRNVDEALRLLQAVQFVEKHGEVCPANWNEGDKTMKPTREGVQKYFGG